MLIKRNFPILSFVVLVFSCCCRQEKLSQPIGFPPASAPSGYCCREPTTRVNHAKDRSAAISSTLSVLSVPFQGFVGNTGLAFTSIHFELVCTGDIWAKMEESEDEVANRAADRVVPSYFPFIKALHV